LPAQNTQRKKRLQNKKCRGDEPRKKKKKKNNKAMRVTVEEIGEVPGTNVTAGFRAWGRKKERCDQKGGLK